MLLLLLAGHCYSPAGGGQLCDSTTIAGLPAATPWQCCWWGCCWLLSGYVCLNLVHVFIKATQPMHARYRPAHSCEGSTPATSKATSESSRTDGTSLSLHHMVLLVCDAPSSESISLSRTLAPLLWNVLHGASYFAMCRCRWWGWLWQLQCSWWWCC
jgi:hypothetical protein